MADPPGTPSVGTPDFAADSAVGPEAPASAGSRQYAIVSFTVSSETWVSGQGPGDTGWTLVRSLNLTTPNSNSPDRGNTARVEVWEQDTPSTAAVAWTKSGTRRYAAFRISWPGVGGTPVFALPVQTSGQTSHVTPTSTVPANTAAKVVALAIVDQGPTPVTLTAPGSPWTAVVDEDLPTPLISETQSIRLLERAYTETPSPSTVSATFTTSAVEEAFLISWMLPATASASTAAEAFGWGTPLPESDDFTAYPGGTTVPAPAKWNLYDGVGHDGNGIRSPAQCAVSGGFLRIHGLQNGTTGGMAHVLNQKYGRWEVRASIKAAPGATGDPYHAVTLLWPEEPPFDWPAAGETDFLEVDVGDTGATAIVHYPNHEPKQQEEASWPGLDITEPHNYAVEWTSEHVRGFIDGVVWYTFDQDGIQNAPRPMHLCLQLDDFFGTPTLQEAYLDVEWANVYALDGEDPDPDPPAAARTRGFLSLL